MNWSNILTVYLKELRDQLRDRRTLISMFLIPTIAIPGILTIVGTVTSRTIKQAKAETPTVMLLGAGHSPHLREVFAASDQVELVAASDDYRDLISNKRLRAAVQVPDDFDAALAEERPVEVKIFDYSGDLKSGFAASAVRRLLDDYREQVLDDRLMRHGLSRSIIKPFSTSEENVAPPAKVGGNAIGGLIPYLFILLCFTGAMHPAVDLTAGEKERGTMETILCSPISRLELVLGKFIMVLTASLTTVACSLVSMTVSFLLIGNFIGGPGGGMGNAKMAGGGLPTLDPAGLLASLALVLPLAVFFSALLLAISVAAKTPKEAQSYVAPMVIVIVVPAMMAMLPGVELSSKLALVPILNVSLLCKELVSGSFPWDKIALIFGSTCVYAAAALAFCVRQFNREEIIFRT